MLATYDLFLYRKTNMQTYTSMNEYLLLKSYPLGAITQQLTVESFQYTCIPTVMVTLIEDILEWYWSIGLLQCNVMVLVPTMHTNSKATPINDNGYTYHITAVQLV